MNPQTLTRIVFAWTCYVLVGWFAPSAGHADISLPKIFSDHMVLQRNARVKIWGNATAGQQLTVKFAGKELKTTAAPSGQWSVHINTPGAGGPYELEVIADGGEPKVKFSDVLVGEVWICAGQDNMEFPVSKSLDAQTEIDNAKDFPLIRLFTVGNDAAIQPLTDFKQVDPWRVCSPETVKKYSATAYYFGRELSKQLKGIDPDKDVPIGLIDASWNGTVCEAWTSRASMENVGELSELLKHWDEQIDQLTSPLRPGNLYNGMIAPIARFPVRGVIWYQGEANLERGAQFASLFPTLIKDWRKNFGNENLPFYFVQLSPFRYQQKPEEALAEIWDAQLKTLKTVPNTRMVVTTDIGDIEVLTPSDKQEVGRRLAWAAMADTYAGLLPAKTPKPVYSGPIFDTATVDQDKIRLTFKHVVGGLKIRGDEPALTCFEICGEDKKFVPADAKIDGDRIVVSAPGVSQPVAVRFGWSDTAQPNLVNSHDLPASPFRTDEFSLISEGRDF